MNAIDVQDLRKTFQVQKNRDGLKGALLDLFKREYNEVMAVKDISFTIPQGEICGYIGENGAGKSTTIKMLTGILVPTAGDIHVNGFIPHKEREKFVRGIGVVFGQRSQLWWDIGVIESFRLLRKVYRVPEKEFKQRLDELVDRLSLQELLNRPVRKLSLGQRMRCELVASLLHRPSVLFLDEPTIGLDIVVKTEIREFLKQLNAEHGTTILLTTHDLQDIEALCTRVIMLDDGRIIYDGGLDALKSTWGKGREVRFQFAKPMRAGDVEALTSGLDVEWTMESPYEAGVLVPFATNVSDVIGRVVGGTSISDLSIIETNTDDIVREIYKAGTAEKPAGITVGSPLLAIQPEKEAEQQTLEGAEADTEKEKDAVTHG
ncbi:ABC transporter ATP-binding protein [Paenibacillus alvei]|uniref:ABC transporter ATP-binding protein n=1 Tax=Paenibacillus alvei TaxID=44250 RepID=A0ABT4GVN6_PAEAL|nr:ABC transporter ATP-binding protein [Paenibacillus alvei]MCY7485685.1 ABC transporter ATP-binding protein [Paenibacillus alvei]MCY9760757.1 ABC transporter ATP-binding protein [Paenibacillus alvei]MCY9765864.1 ABC transporter ATP-binding protein [Paenibacillus alvei]